MTEKELMFIEKLVTDYSTMLEKYGRRCVNYQENFYPYVEDALQQTFLKAVSHVHRLMRHDNVVGWLKASLHHDLLHQLRSLRRHRELSFSDPDTHTQIEFQRLKETLEEMDRDITLTDLKEAVRVILTQDEQEIFKEYFMDGQTTKDTAENLSLSAGSVRGKIRTIRKKLKIYFFMCAVYLFVRTI